MNNSQSFHQVLITTLWYKLLHGGLARAAGSSPMNHPSVNRHQVLLSHDRPTDRVHTDPQRLLLLG